MKAIRGVSYAISTITMFLGLPLIGWGIQDLGDFFSSVQRVAYGVIVISAAIVVGYQAIETPEGIRGTDGQRDKSVKRQSLVRYGVSILLLGALIFIPYCDRREILVMSDLPTIRWLGIGLFTLGLGLVYWSGIALGRLYSPEVTLQEDHKLVTSGPYRYIRHPRYLGGTVYGLGLAFLFRSWIGLLLTVIFFVVILFRLRDEEAFMRNEFGQTWDEYCSRSWRLIPWIY